MRPSELRCAKVECSSRSIQSGRRCFIPTSRCEASTGTGGGSGGKLARGDGIRWSTIFNACKVVMLM